MDDSLSPRKRQRSINEAHRLAAGVGALRAGESPPASVGCVRPRPRPPPLAPRAPGGWRATAGSRPAVPAAAGNRPRSARGAPARAPRGTGGFRGPRATTAPRVRRSQPTSRPGGRTFGEGDTAGDRSPEAYGVAFPPPAAAKTP